MSKLSSPLEPLLQAELERWRSLPEVDETLPHWQTRYVCLDIATTGLAVSDRLCSVAALGIRQGVIRASDACAGDLGQGAESGSSSTAVQLLALLTFLGKDPLVTYQAPFVDAFLKPAFEQHLGLSYSPQWIDLGWVLPELFGGHTGARLDDWLQRFAISLPGRRQAMPDAFAIAQLLLAVQAAGQKRGIDTARHLREIERNRRWLGQG